MTNPLVNHIDTKRLVYILLYGYIVIYRIDQSTLYLVHMLYACCVFICMITISIYSATDPTDYKGILNNDKDIAQIYTRIHELLHYAINTENAPLSAGLKRIELKSQQQRQLQQL